MGKVDFMDTIYGIDMPFGKSLLKGSIVARLSARMGIPQHSPELLTEREEAAKSETTSRAAVA
jgi:hypothetical protein